MVDGVRVAAVVKLIESLMVLPDKNCTERMDTPSAKEFLTNLEPFQVVLLAIASVFNLVVYVLALVHWYYVYSFVLIETRRNKLYWPVTLFPVSTGCCLIGMLAPRTSLIMTALGILYYLMCLFVIVSLCSVFERVKFEVEVSVRKRLPTHKLITSLRVLLLAFGDPLKCRLHPLC
ncbi:hypothetical protein Y032_0006g2992 [Ancylostoma ceylanicum]|uniref:Uncharacterized protein n=2 Tax=Ancylostoma ceylanicum TaxID=53326 RepID=A0A016VR13_9BILA|nr:hypothetical protein Y032_0006g2992 [Ancylostoma ceylanicum]